MDIPNNSGILRSMVDSNVVVLNVCKGVAIPKPPFAGIDRSNRSIPAFAMDLDAGSMRHGDMYRPR